MVRLALIRPLALTLCASLGLFPGPAAAAGVLRPNGAAPAPIVPGPAGISQELPGELPGAQPLLDPGSIPPLTPAAPAPLAETAALPGPPQAAIAAPLAPVPELAAAPRPLAAAPEQPAPDAQTPALGSEEFQRGLRQTASDHRDAPEAPGPEESSALAARVFSGAGSRPPEDPPPVRAPEPGGAPGWLKAASVLAPAALLTAAPPLISLPGLDMTRTFSMRDVGEAWLGALTWGQALALAAALTPLLVLFTALMDRIFHSDYDEGITEQITRQVMEKPLASLGFALPISVYFEEAIFRVLAFFVPAWLTLQLIPGFPAGLAFALATFPAAYAFGRAHDYEHPWAIVLLGMFWNAAFALTGSFFLLLVSHYLLDLALLGLNAAQMAGKKK